MEIEQYLKQLILKEAENKNIDLEKRNNFHLINDLEFDSLQVINLVISIETEFNIEFDDEDMEFELVCQFDELVRIVKKALSVEK